ncbi:MAG TPA: tRNA (adenosine(37)-N6)-threonylcarbamoyltransferase complex dimerization subunit type 1 TsaB [Clostridiaceae bacterium]|nr:tRNA (adenosine(37)-N6)-threonylcarbamoyltransferase complex dimerization subunit type 1 TsaB [Clostridiaceae bacterium]
MLILSVDTSGKSLSVSLCEDEMPLVETTLNLGYKHSVTLQPLIEDVIKRSGRDKREIDLFACTNGPGSFTGIRIGVAAIKTIAWALGKPAIGVSSLETLAASFPSAIVCPVLDARGGRVFSALYKVTNIPEELLAPANRQSKDLWQDINRLGQPSGLISRPDPDSSQLSAPDYDTDFSNSVSGFDPNPVLNSDSNLDSDPGYNSDPDSNLNPYFNSDDESLSRMDVDTNIEAAVELKPDQIIVVGDGLPAVRSALNGEFAETQVIWTTQEHWTPRASILSRLAYLKFKAGDSGDPFALIPEYYSLSQAERLYEKKDEQNKT